MTFAITLKLLSSQMQNLAQIWITYKWCLPLSKISHTVENFTFPNDNLQTVSEVSIYELPIYGNVTEFSGARFTKALRLWLDLS